MAQHPSDDLRSAGQRRDEHPATDKIAGLAHTLIKIVFGVAGSRTFVTTANPFPVTVAAGATSITPKYARVNLATTTSTEIVAAVSGKKIRVVAVWLIYHGTGTFTIGFLSATTDIAGPYLAPSSTTVASPLILIPDANGYFETVANEALMIKPGSATVLGGSLVYIEV